MAWSTRELADLAGTTVNTVRHYHLIGLLEEPERRYNGYKQYRSRHLIELVRIRRMVDLGVPLAQMSEAGNGAPGTLRCLDERLRAGIERLERARADVAAIAGANAPLDTPRGFELVASELSAPDRAFLQLCARLADQETLPGLAETIAREPRSVREAFWALAADADDGARYRVVDGITRSAVNWRGLSGSGTQGRVLAEARRDLYNSAQQWVIVEAARAAAFPSSVAATDGERSAECAGVR